MAIRVIEALIGAALAALGGYFAWINRGAVDGMFPPEPGYSVWTFVGGLVALIVGLVAVVHALGPRPREKARRVEETEKRARILRQAEQFYTAQAEDLASPVRHPDQPLFPEGLRPAGRPIQPPRPDAPVTEREPASPPPIPFQLHSLSQPPAPSVDEAGTLNTAAPPSAPPVATPPPVEPDLTTSAEAPLEPETVEPVPTVAPEPPPTIDAQPPAIEDPPEVEAEADAVVEPAPPELAARPFPAAAGIIPGAIEPPPPTANGSARPASTTGDTQEPSPSATTQGKSDLSEIRTAIAEKRLEEADRLLADTRKRLNEAGAAEPIELARLTGLAGDHAAADGRLGSAKWLWRLALQRFAAAGAIDDPSAREVSERMRLADQ